MTKNPTKWERLAQEVAENQEQTLLGIEREAREKSLALIASGQPLTTKDTIDAIYRRAAGERQRELEIRLRDADKSEFRRLVRCGRIYPRQEDFPEIPDSEWHRGTITLRGWGYGLAIGRTISVDPENYARLYQIENSKETTVDEDDRPRKVTKLEVTEVQIDGKYDVLPGPDTYDATLDVVSMISAAQKQI